jgi:hypothetical protein
MINKEHTIALQHEGRLYKLLKLIYGADGSVYITSPYHPCKEGRIHVFTVNYTLLDSVVSFSQAIELASVDDKSNGFKLSHHISGLIQVSGKGITSGVDEQGKPKGIAIQSFPLTRPVGGPTFCAVIYGFEHFKQASKVESDFHVFNYEEFQHPTFNALVIEAHCFPSLFRRFVRQESERIQTIRVVHPNGAVLPLRAAFPPVPCDCQSFFGLELYFIEGEADQEIPSIFLSTATGNVRLNEKDERLGDAIFCTFPRVGEITGERNLNYTAFAPR